MIPTYAVVGFTDNGERKEDASDKRIAAPVEKVGGRINAEHGAARRPDKWAGEQVALRVELAEATQRARKGAFLWVRCEVNQAPHQGRTI